jgi:hypothetical protein
MPIDLTCSCGRQLRVADEFAGRQGRCPACGAVLDIPQRDALVSHSAPSPHDEAQALTDTPGLVGPAPPDSPEYATTRLSQYPAEGIDEPDELSRPTYKLYSPGCIGLVALLAGPVGAFILMTLNFWRLGKRRAAWMTIAVALITIAALMAISIVLPDSWPSFLIGLPVFLVLWASAKALQGSAYDRHTDAGGSPASGWSAAGIALLGIGLYFGVFFLVFLTYDFFFNEGFGQKITYASGEEVYYAKGATEADARALGEALHKSGFFDGKGRKSVRVSLDGNRLVISFVVKDRVLRDPKMQDAFRTVGREASQQAFGGRPVVVELCDQYFEVKKKL